MTKAVSVEDLFLVGVSFDLLGGYFLARGLLLTPREIAKRATLDASALHSVVAREIRATADARLGLCSLTIGFVLQAVGYIVVLTGAHVKTGPERTLVAVVLAVLVGFAALSLSRYPSRLLRTRIAHDVITIPPASLLTGGSRGATLAGLSDALGITVESLNVPAEAGPLDQDTGSG